MSARPCAVPATRPHPHSCTPTTFPAPVSWFGCTNGATENPRAAEWSQDFGEPLNTCAETAPGSGVYEREWTKATVAWDCNARHGSITPK